MWTCPAAGLSRPKGRCRGSPSAANTAFELTRGQGADSQPGFRVILTTLIPLKSAIPWLS
jgi:hypothetical protein